MTFTCPKCKAIFNNNETCQDHFEYLQSKELTNPDYYVVHYLSVPCFMLQHNQYSRDGWLDVRRLLSKYIYENWTLNIARLHAQQVTESRRYALSFTRSLKLIEVDKIAWNFVINNVRDQNSDVYCKDVRQWATKILEDTETLIQHLKESG